MNSSSENAERNIAAAKHFEDRAEEWTAIYTPAHSRYQYFQWRKTAIEEEIRTVLKGQRCKRCIDVGCGSGPYLPMLAQYAERVYGMDVAPSMLRETAQNLSDKVEDLTLVVGSATAMPFPDDFFDVSIYVGVVEYFDDVSKVLAEARRVLAPGGHAFVTAPHLWGLGRLSGLPRTITLFAPPRWKFAVGSLIDRIKSRPHDPSRYYLGAAYTQSRIVKLAREAGFTLEAVHCTGFQLRKPVRWLLGDDRSNRWEVEMQSKRNTSSLRHFADDLILVLTKN